MSSNPETAMEQCGSALELKVMPASPGRRPLSQLQESGSGSPVRVGSGAVNVSSGRTCIQDHQNNNTSSTKSSSSPAAAAAPAPALASSPSRRPVPLNADDLASEPYNADGNATEYAQNDQLPPPPPPPPARGSPALPPEVPLSPVQQRQLSSRNLLSKNTTWTGNPGGDNDNNVDLEQQMDSSSSAGRDDAERARGIGSNNDCDMDGGNAHANDEDASFTYESDCAVAATPQQQQHKRPPFGTPALLLGLDKENGTAGAAAAAATTSSVLSPMRSAGGTADTSTGVASPTAYDFNAAADGAATVADRSVTTYGTSSTANSRTHLLPGSRRDAGAGAGSAGWSSSAPSTPISGHSRPTTTATASSAAATAAATSVSAAMGFGGKKKKQKNTTPTRGGSSGLMLSRIGAKLGRKRPSSTSSRSLGGTPGAGDGACMHFSPSTPIKGGGMAMATASASASADSSADEFTLNRRNSGMPDVNSFPLGANGKKGNSSGAGGGSGGLRRFKAKNGKIPSRKLNLPSTSLSALSVAGMSGSAYEEAGLLDNDGKPTDTSLDMDDADHHTHTATSTGVGGIFGGPDFRASPPRSGGFSDGIGVHSSLTAAAAAAAAAAIGGVGANESSSCPLTPTDTYARHSLPPAAVLNTPPASSPSPLFVSAKKIGSEIRQRHDAKRRKGSNRRTKKVRRSLRAAQKAAEVAAAEEASSDNCGAGSTEGNNVAVAGSGGPRRLDSSPDRNDGAKVASSSSASGSKPVSVDDSFSSADSSQDGVGGIPDAAEGDMSKSLEEMELNTPTSDAEALQAARDARRSDSDGTDGVASRDFVMDIPEVRRSSPSERQTGGFPLVLKAPASPSGSSSLTRRAEDFDAAPWHHKRDNNFDYDHSDSDTDSYSDDSTTSSLGYQSMPKPPETATQEEKSRFYWEQLYGAPPPRPPSSRPLPHLLAGLGSSTTSLQQGQEHYPLQGSWSASRAPPSKPCLSSRKQASQGPASRSTPMLSDRFGSLMHSSPDPIAAPDVMATPGRNDGMFTPKKGSPTDDYTPPGNSNGKMTGGDEEKRYKHSVVFGNSKAAEFDTTCPTDQIVSLPDDEAKIRFPVEYVEATVEEEFMHEETVHNSDVLDEWEQSFDSLMDDDEDGDSGARDDNEGVPPSAMDCYANLSACFADDDMTPFSRPKRPKKKKRRKSKHRYRDSSDGEDRRKSSLFFSPGGGSLLGSDDEMDQDPTPSREKGRVSMGSAVDAEEVGNERGRGFLSFSPPSSEGVQPGSINNAAGDHTSPTINGAKNLFGPLEEPSAEPFEVGPDEADESNTLALFTRLIDAQSIDRLDRPLTSATSVTDVNTVVTEYMIRRANNRDMSDFNLDSICQVNPLILQSAPTTIRNELLNGVEPTPEPSKAESTVNETMSAADFCSKLAQTALYEWRTREVEIIKKLSSSIQTACDSCDETFKSLDHLLSISQNDAPQRTSNLSGLHQQIQQLEEIVTKEENALDASIKLRCLTHAELEVEQSPPNPEWSYQLLSAILPIQIESLGEDMLQTSFFDDVSGFCTKISWKLSCGSPSDEASPQQGGGGKSSPKAIQSFEASSITNPVDITSSQLPPSIRSLQRSLLRNFITGESSASSDDEYCAGLDRFISCLANIHADFPSAFAAIVDLLNKVRLLELDMSAINERSDCVVEVLCHNESLVGLLIRIAFEDGSSLGVNLNLDQFNRCSVPTFIPSDVTIVSIGNHAIEKELWRKLTATVESTLRARQGCNAFLFNDIVSKCVDEVLASREI